MTTHTRIQAFNNYRLAYPEDTLRGSSLTKL